MAIIGPRPPLPEMVRLFEQRSNELIDWRLEDGRGILETELRSFITKVKWCLNQPVSQFLWFILFDAIHHRGQAGQRTWRPDGWQGPLDLWTFGRREASVGIRRNIVDGPKSIHLEVIDPMSSQGFLQKGERWKYETYGYILQF